MNTIIIGNLEILSEDIGKITYVDAKTACEKLNINGTYDWRLPSKEELLLMYSNKERIGSFYNGFYWSKENTLTREIYALNFQVGRGSIMNLKDIILQESFKLYSNYYTRPVRTT